VVTKTFGIGLISPVITPSHFYFLSLPNVSIIIFRVTNAYPARSTSHIAAAPFLHSQTGGLVPLSLAKSHKLHIRPSYSLCACMVLLAILCTLNTWTSLIRAEGIGFIYQKLQKRLMMRLSRLLFDMDTSQ
jgi:hypothetical protein